MKNYCLYIVQTSGVPIYYQNFSEEFQNSEYPLVTSFFGAIMQFSQQVIKEQLNIIEIGKYRIFFRYQQDLIFIIITENTSSILLINERLDRIVLTLYNYINVEKVIESKQMLENPEISEKFYKIMHLQDDYSDLKTEVIKNLVESEIASGDVEAGALLSLKGEIFYSSLPLEELHIALREIEIRTMVGSQDIIHGEKFIRQNENNAIFSKTIFIPALSRQVYIVLLFDNRVNLGMADFLLDEICQKLEKIDL
ncbi:MAG: hypothetical protein K9W44_01335 [Candidatus Lokiarchaeota archaeon]|nr:hypothetical protein [Candidatus Harpocratesius repetitus]